MQPNPGGHRLIHIQQSDNMAPEIPAGAIVIVDTSITWWVKDAFYLVNLPGKVGTAFPPSQQVLKIIQPGPSIGHEHERWIAYPNPNYDNYWAPLEALDIAGLVIGSIRCHQH